MRDHASLRVAGNLKNRWVFVSLGMVVLVALFARAMTREPDGDEDQFVAPPAALAQDGWLPYVDYPYFHMPNLVFLQAGLTGWAPYKLLASRCVSAVCGTATVFLLFYLAWRALDNYPENRRWRLAGGLVLIFACSRMFTYTTGLAWNHDTAMLCLLAAFVFHDTGMHRGRLTYLAVAGFLVGMAIGIRLAFAFSFLPFVASLLAGQCTLTRRQRLAALGLAAFSACLALAPAFILFARAPDNFMFGNIGFANWSTRWYQLHDPRATTLPGKVFYLLKYFVLDPGNLFLLAAWLVALFLLRQQQIRVTSMGRKALFCAGMVTCLLPGTLGPTPLFYQYTYLLLPFMVLGIVFAIAAFPPEYSATFRWQRSILVATLIVAGVGLPRWYWKVVYLPFPDRWETVIHHRRGIWLRENVAAKGPVLTSQPGLAAEAGLEIYPEHVTGCHAFRVGPLLDEKLRQRYRLQQADDWERLFADRPPSLVVFTRSHFHEKLARVAEKHGYSPLATNDEELLVWSRLGAKSDGRQAQAATPASLP